ncbi:MAG: Tricarboxylate transport protein TctC [Rhodoferax sp.]|nr:Tricarboxylate transport protein TctC [Rhodoferax sp.]
MNHPTAIRMRRRAAMKLTILATLAAVTGVASPLAFAQPATDYPRRPVRLIVPFPPGGGNDNVARPIAAKAAELLGQPIVIDNRPGAGTTMGADMAAKSAPDGYTLLIGSIGSHILSPYLYKRLPYDPVKDFEPVALLATAPNVLVVGKDAKYNSLAELVAAAKAAPGSLTYASPGVGTPAHLAAEIFKKQAGLDILHVPYKGGANYLPDIIAKRVDMVFDTTTSSIPFMRSGQLRALAISRPERLADFPAVPTFAQAGYPAYDTGSWYGVFAPAGTPRAIVERLATQFHAAVQDGGVSKLLTGLGADPVGSSSKVFSDFLKTEATKYGQVMADTPIQPE